MKMKKRLFYYGFLMTALLSFMGIAQSGQAQEQSESARDLTKNEHGCVKWGPDSSKTLQKLSLYHEFFKQQNYDDALEHWWYVFNNAPGAKQYPYIHGIKMYKTKVKKAQDEALKAKLVDTLMMIYDQRLRCFGPDNDDVLGRKAIAMVQYQKDSVEEMYNTFKKSLDIAGKEWKYYFLQPYVYSVILGYKDKLVDKQELLKQYGRVVDIIDHNVDNDHEKKEKYQEARDKVDKLMSKTNLLNCENLREILGKQYHKNPQDTALWQRIFRQMSRAKCYQDSLFLVATEKYNEVNPTAPKAYFLARSYNQKGNTNAAMELYQKAIKLEEDDGDKADYHLEIAKIHKKNGDFPKAREAALKAAELNSEWGEPYLFIGDLYSSSGDRCGPGTGFKSQVVTWPAVDMYQKAKQVDPSVAERANKNIQNYQSFFPKKQECFFRDLNEGDAYEVGCWINRKTTVRCKEKDQ